MGKESIYNRLLEDLKTAMREKNSLKIAVIRHLRAALKNEMISKKGELSEGDEINVLTRAVKMRREAMESYEKGGRDELVRKERKELEIIQEYLPRQLTEKEITKIVEEAIVELKAETITDLGRVMAVVMPKVKGRADGRMVQQIVKDKLGG
ncbi:MAG: GatB/YqeY domain-containing protein [Fidelibacterota bacterium]